MYHPSRTPLYILFMPHHFFLLPQTEEFLDFCATNIVLCLLHWFLGTERIFLDTWSTDRVRCITCLIVRLIRRAQGTTYIEIRCFGCCLRGYATSINTLCFHNFVVKMVRLLSSSIDCKGVHLQNEAWRWSNGWFHFHNLPYCYLSRIVRPFLFIFKSSTVLTPLPIGIHNMVKMSENINY